MDPGLLLIGGGLLFLLTQMGKKQQPRGPGPGTQPYQPTTQDNTVRDTGLALQLTGTGLGILGSAVGTVTGIIKAAGGGSAAATGGATGGGAGGAGGGGGGAGTGTTVTTVSTETVAVGAGISASYVAFVAGFIVVVIGLILAGVLIPFAMSQAQFVARSRQVRGGRRYAGRILEREQKNFESLVEKLQRDLNASGAKASREQRTAWSPITFTRAYFDANMSQHVDLSGAQANYYFVDSIDSRISIEKLAQARAFFRYFEWTLYAEMNRCLYSFYSERPSELAVFAMPPNALDGALAQFFADIPAALTPPQKLPGGYSSIRSMAGSIASSMGASLSVIEARARFLGVATAVLEAANPVTVELDMMGTPKTAYLPRYLGPDGRATDMGERLGLFARGWITQNWDEPGYGRVSVLVDPTTGWGIDVWNTAGTNSMVLFKGPGKTWQFVDPASAYGGVVGTGTGTTQFGRFAASAGRRFVIASRGRYG
jgi:hypothetical protein